MADVWLDFPSGSPGLYGTNTALMSNGVYSVVGIELQEDPDPNVTGIVIRIGAGSQDSTDLRKILPTTQDKVGVAFRLWQNSLDQQGWGLCFNKNDASRQISITSNSSGQLIVKQGSPRSGTVLATSPLNTIVANAWQNIEFMCESFATGGTVRVQVEGIPVDELTLDGVATGGPYSQVEYTHTGNFSGALAWVKDLRIWDGSGGWGTGFPGTTQVVDLGPTGDVSTGWSRTGGASDAGILDNTPPVDTQFISADNPPPAPSIVTLADLPINVTSVRSVMPILRGKKSDGGDGNIQMSLINGGNNAYGADRPMTTAFTYWWDIMHLDPATGNQYTPAGLDTTTLQFNRTI
ncbi:MAG: hypothetical protein H0X34_07180 [Chthoniobacterales bacterium]|nr:hypothetical protein [Chthoniobacterales bacterium]